jgi:protein-L-isoaspartate O-methyltransferase
MSSRRRGTSVAHVQNVLGFHRSLLEDGVRNRAFHRALRQRVAPGHRVLDIGAGSGVWAVTAAQLGAREVVAVEKEPLLVDVVYRLAHENGVGDRVRVVQGDSRKLDLGRRFDVVVSETVGNEAFDEGIVPLLADARRRFLRRGGVIIPERLSLMAAPARRLALGRKTPGVSKTSLDALAVHLPDGFSAREVRLVADPAALITVTLGEQESVDLRQLSASWRGFTQRRRIDGFAVWASMRLARAVHLATLWNTHWHPFWYGIEPIRTPGTVSFSLALGRPRLHWEVRWQEGPMEREAHYSPAFACAALTLGLRFRAKEV